MLKIGNKAPAFKLKNRNGDIISLSDFPGKWIINPDGKISQIWSNVKVRTKNKSGEVRHADIVKACLLELIANK